MHKNAIDLTGQKFGMLQVLSEAGRSSDKKVMWMCRCDCGTVKAHKGSHLRSGGSTSCGCERMRLSNEACITHGATKTRAYSVWESMLQRCTNPKNKRWDRYGGRGISVCERWKIFSNFLEDMGHPPVGLTLDRQDNDGNYEPGNCQWATAFEQSINRSKPRASSSFLARKVEQLKQIEIVKPGQIWEALYDTAVKTLEIISVDVDVVWIRRTGLRPPYKGLGLHRPYPIVKANRERFNGMSGGYRLLDANQRYACVDSWHREFERPQ